MKKCSKKHKKLWHFWLWTILKGQFMPFLLILLGIVIDKMNYYWHPVLQFPHLGCSSTTILWGFSFTFVSFVVEICKTIGVADNAGMIQVLAGEEKPKEREMVGGQRHSSVWASLVRRLFGCGVAVVLVMEDGGCGDWRWLDHLWSASQSGQNSRTVKKCSHFNIPPEHK